MVKKSALHFDRTDFLPLAVLALVFVMSVFLLYSHYVNTKEQVKRHFDQEKVMEARYAAQQIQHFMEHEKGDLLNAAGTLPMMGSAEKAKAALDLYFRPGQRQRKLFSFSVLDEKGRFLYSVPESLVDRYHQALSGEDYFSEAVKRRGFYITNPRADNKGGWAVMLSMPMTASKGGDHPDLLGVMVEQIDLRAIDQLFIDKVDAGKGGYAFLVDGNGRLIAHQKSGQLYQIENSSDMLRRMMAGEEGSVVTKSQETGEVELAAFSPVKFGGLVWSVGIIVPDIAVDDLARRNLERTLLIISLMALAFVWSLLTVTRSSRYRAGVRERTRASEHLALKDREFSALNNLSDALSGGGDLGGMLARAMEIIRQDVGAKGVAVRLAAIPTGELVLTAHSGTPVRFAEMASCDAKQCLCGGVMSGGRPLYLGREELDAHEGMPCRDLWPDNLVLVPLAVKNKSLGVMYLAGLREEGLSGEGEKFLMALGNQLAAGVENLMQIEDVNRYAARAGALFHTAQALTRSLDLDELLKIIMREAASLLKVKRCMFLLYNEEDNRIDCRVALGFDDTQVLGLSFSPYGVFWDAMEDGGVKVVGPEGKRYEAPRELTERFGLDSFVLVPLMSKGKVLGFMVLELPGGTGVNIEDLRLIVGFANQAALAIETSSFYIMTVEKYNEDLQQLSTRIIQAQEEERKRISRDLHDELGQILTAIKMNIGMVRDGMPNEQERQKARLGDTEGLVASAIDSVRRLSFELRPSMLDDLGLSTVLGKLVSDFRKRTGIEVELTEEGPAERLSPEMEVVLYRVVQEATTNVMKHSRATKVVINLSRDVQKGMVRLYVEDNGVGFSAPPEGQAQQPKGFGLMGIKERVSLLGGNFRVFTEADRGTKLLVDIPWTKGE